MIFNRRHEVVKLRCADIVAASSVEIVAASSGDIVADRQDQTLELTATHDQRVMEISFDEADCRVGVQAPKREGQRRRRLLYRIRPIMMIHLTLSILIQQVQTVLDYVVPPACLFGTTAVDLVSAILSRLMVVIATFSLARRICIVLHHDAAPSCIRAGVIRSVIGH